MNLQIKLIGKRKKKFIKCGSNSTYYLHSYDKGKTLLSIRLK